MRIISKFKDYYDGVQSYGSDPNLVFKRQTIQKEYDLRFIPESLTHTLDRVHKRNDSPYYMSDYYSLYLFFCGKLYTAFDTSLYCKASGGEFKFPFKLPYEQKLEEIRESKKKIQRLVYRYISAGYVKDLYEADGMEVDSDLFRYIGSPIFLLRGEDLHRAHRNHRTTSVMVTIEPNLSDLGLQARVDPYMAYQSLSQYLGGVLVDVEEPHIASDKELLHARGFDQFSFKQGNPGEKKVRRKANKQRKREKTVLK